MSTSDIISNLDAVFGRMAWLCSRREYCSAAVLGKLRQKGLDDKDAAAVLERLVRERYVDDARYARAFVRDKALLSGWGPRKISFAVRQRHIQGGCGRGVGGGQPGGQRGPYVSGAFCEMEVGLGKDVVRAPHQASAFRPFPRLLL